MNSTITTAQKTIAVQMWSRVFCSTDPFGWPFVETMGHGRVLYPTDGCHLSCEQFDVLARVAALQGERFCYLAVVEGSARLSSSCDENVVLIDLSDYENYANLHLTLENAIFSESGGWGLLVSHEMHAVLGGNADFISEFNRLDTLAESQWRDFRTQWCAEEHQAWVSKIAVHVQTKPSGS